MVEFTFGRALEKIIEIMETKMIFSRSSELKKRVTNVLFAQAIWSGVRSGSPASASKRNETSAGGHFRVDAQYPPARMATIATIIACSIHECSFMRSVVSRWATCIQYSCGSLITIRINAAAMIIVLRDSRDGLHRRRAASMKMKKYSNVLGKMSSRVRLWRSSKRMTPTIR